MRVSAVHTIVAFVWLLVSFGGSVKGQLVVVDSDGKKVLLTPEYCSQIDPIEPNLKMSEDTRIRGKITDESGAPFRNSPVELRRLLSPDKQEIVKKALTDAEGSFDLKTVKPGEYRLLLSPSRAFKQPTKLECSSTDCVLETVLKANATEDPAVNCPIR